MTRGARGPYKHNPALAERFRARNEEMVGLYRKGSTLQEIGTSYGVTRERVRQIVALAGFDGADGGMTMMGLIRARKSADMAAKKRAEKEARCFAKTGMTLEQFAAISPLKKYDPKHPWMRFFHQRRSAKQRGIEWEFTFAQWWQLWQESGHWEERGRGKGYCMARWADDGPYSPENVYICTIGQNFSDSFITKPWAERFPDGGIGARPKDAKGWTFRKDVKSRPYAAQAYLAGKNHYLGSFATADEASAAYQAFISNLQPGQCNPRTPAERVEASLPR